MKTTRFFLLILLLATWVCSSPSVAQIVNIPDANLRMAVAETLGKPPLSPITRSDMALLTRLIAHDRGIQDLRGLEFAANLVEIRAYNNFITDLSPIADLISLRDLQLASNLVSDVSPIAGLMNLDRLDLRYNVIADFSPLERLAEKIFIQVVGNPGTSTIIGGKIEGPWLWVILPTGGGGGASAALSGIDFLALMSKNTVTELKIAASGATEGEPVGHSQWTLQKLSPTGGNNLNHMAIAAGLGSGDINHHVAYGSITLDSPRQQQTRMYVGSDDAVKVWLNGELVHNNPVNRGAGDFQEQFAVTLKKGKNVLLVAVYEGGGGWSGFFGFAAGAEYTVNTPTENADLAEDVNADGVVNVQDLVLVSSNLGKTGKNKADVNADGVVDIRDLVRVAGALGNAADNL